MSQLGTQAFQVLALYWLASETGTSGAGAVFMALMLIPPVLLGPWLASQSKRWPTKRVLVGCDALSGLAALPLALALVLEAPAGVTVGLMLITTAMLSTVNAMLMPVLHASVPVLVADKDLTKANSWMLTTHQLAAVAGQGLGGVLYAVAGPLVLCLFNSIGFLLSAAWLNTISHPELKTAASKVDKPSALAAFRTLRTNAEFCWLAGVSALFNLLYAPWLVLLPFHLAGTGQMRAQDLGMALAAYGAGSLTGASVLKNLVRAVGTNLLGGTLLCLSAGLILLGSVQGVLAIAGVLFFLGAGIGIANVQTLTRVQTLVPAGLRTEAVAVLRTSVHLATPVGFAVVAICHQGLNMLPGDVYQVCGAVLGLALIPLVRHLSPKGNRSSG